MATAYWRTSFRVLGVALVGAAPARVACHGHGRGKGPVQAGDPHLQRCDLADTADQLRVAGSPQADVVREYRGPGDVVMPVDGIGPPQHRDDGGPGAADRGLIEPIRQGEPLTRCSEFVVAGRRVAAVQDRPEGIVPQIIGSHAADVGLDQLADLLLGCHAREQFLDARLQCLVPGQRGRKFGPALRMDGRRRLDCCDDRRDHHEGHQCAPAIPGDLGRSPVHGG